MDKFNSKGNKINNNFQENNNENELRKNFVLNSKIRKFHPSSKLMINGNNKKEEINEEYYENSYFFFLFLLFSNYNFI